jgi:hypothetical protein
LIYLWKLPVRSKKPCVHQDYEEMDHAVKLEGGKEIKESIKNNK